MHYELAASVRSARGDHSRSVAPKRSAATATPASFASVASAAVSVRSAARNRRAKVSDFVPLVDAGAAVVVDQPRVFEQLARALAHRGQHVAGRDVDATRRATGPASRPGSVPIGVASAPRSASCDQRVEVELDDAPRRAAGRASSAIAGSSSPATPTDASSPTRSSAVRPGCSAGCAPCDERDVGAERRAPSWRAASSASAMPDGRPRRRRAACGTASPRKQRADVPRLRRDAGVRASASVAAPGRSAPDGQRSAAVARRRPPGGTPCRSRTAPGR